MSHRDGVESSSIGPKIKKNPVVVVRKHVYKYKGFGLNCRLAIVAGAS